MIQDIQPREYDITYRNILPEAEDLALIFFNERVLMKYTEGSEESAAFLTFSEAEELTGLTRKKLGKNSRFLFSIDERNFFLLDVESMETEMSVQDFEKELHEALTEGTVKNVSKWTAQTAFRTLEERWICYAGVTAMQLYRWYKNRRFCGNCGTTLIHSDKERAMICPDCGNVEYPKISPAVIVGIVDGDRLLLTRYADRPYKRYALIAGFCEVGETLEATVRREVMEEVGLKVKNIRYYKCQPWSFSDSLLAGFFAELDGSDEVVLRDGELAEGKWFEREEIPVPQETIALTAEMIRFFANGGNPFK